MTILLRCLNCGFSFTVTYPAAAPSQDSLPVACGHCRSSHWSTQTA